MRVVKTTFEEEQKIKDEAFLALDPMERLRLRLQTRQKMKKKGIDYSYEGKVVVKKTLS